MRFLKVAGFLLAISIGWSIIIRGVAGRPFGGVVSTGEILGMAFLLFLISLVGALFGLIGPKARSNPILTPVVAGALAATAWAVLVLAGASVQ